MRIDGTFKRSGGSAAAVFVLLPLMLPWMLMTRSYNYIHIYILCFVIVWAV